MRLAEFLLKNVEDILEKWQEFAATLFPAAHGMTPLALRDHAPAILDAIAKDIDSPQTSFEQSEKSKGRAPKIPHAPATAAETHAVLRAQCGFDINQLVS